MKRVGAIVDGGKVEGVLNLLLIYLEMKLLLLSFVPEGLRSPLVTFFFNDERLDSEISYTSPQVPSLKPHIQKR